MSLVKERISSIDVNSFGYGTKVSVLRPGDLIKVARWLGIYKDAELHELYNDRYEHILNWFYDVEPGTLLSIISVGYYGTPHLASISMDNYIGPRPARTHVIFGTCLCYVMFTDNSECLWVELYDEDVVKV